MFVSTFSTTNIALTVTFERESDEFSKGYRNQIEERIAAGVIPTAGSDKLTFSEYKLLSHFAAKSISFYAHGCLVLAWNMMTRSSSTADIKYQHMRMNGDRIIVVIRNIRMASRLVTLSPIT
jgi:murein endopeptidase